MDIEKYVIKGNILLVDDESSILDALVRRLRKHVIPAPYTALSGQEALSILRHNAIDIMVTDVQMPEVDGIKLISLAKQIQPELECIVLTGFAGMDNVADAMRQGAVDYLEKPFKTAELVLSLKRSMERVRIVKMAYKRLMVANRKNNMILKSAPIPIISLDADGLIVMINHAAVELFQYDNTQLLGKNFHTLVHHSRSDGTPYPEKECPVFIARQNNESLERITETFWRHDNSSFTSTVSCNPLIEDSKMVGTVIVLEDQNELMYLQSIQHECEERDAALNEHVPTGIVWIDADTHVIVDANISALKLLKATKNQLVGRGCHDFFCQTSAGCIDASTSPAVINEKNSIKDISGSIISVKQSISSVTISGRNYLMLSFMDTTIQDKIDSDIRSINETFHSIVSRTCDGILIIDFEGIVQFANPAALELFGLQHDDMVGQLFGFPSVSGESVEIELINSKGKGIIAEMRVADTEWKGEKAYIANLHDVSIRKKLEEYTLYTANHDPLTGLLNRNLLKDRLQQMLTLANRYEQIVALLFIDLDSFKNINDTHGHDAGDAVLIEIAKRLTKHFRASDTIARIGGDEFLVTLRDIKETSNLDQIVKNLIKKISEPIQLEKEKVNVGCSIGISLYPQHGVDLEQLIKKADTAMYRAKEKGEKSYGIFNVS